MTDYNFDKKNHTLHEILPFDPKIKKYKDLQHGLKEYKVLLKAFVEAIHALKHGDQEKLDSLVGENACQIRAIWIASLSAKDLSNFDKLETEISKVITRIKDLLQPKTIARLMHVGQCLHTIIEENSLTILLSTNELLVLLTFLLSETKELLEEEEFIDSLCGREIAIPKKLKRFGEVSTQYCAGLVRAARKSITAASVQYVRALANSLDDKHLKKMVSEDFTVYHHNWPCIPMFWAYKTLLAFAANEGIPFILKVKFLHKEHTHRFRVVEENAWFIQDIKKPIDLHLTKSKLKKSDLDKVVCVVGGIAVIEGDLKHSKKDWKSVMEAHSLYDIILAGAADHRQYPISTHDQQIDALADKEFEKYRAMARKEGFALENSKTFFIRHVYAATSKKVL